MINLKVFAFFHPAKFEGFFHGKFPSKIESVCFAKRLRGAGPTGGGAYKYGPMVRSTLGSRLIATPVANSVFLYNFSF